MTIEVTLPLRIVSEANQRGHWAKGARRAKEQRGTVKLALWARCERSKGYGHGLTTQVVTLTRIAPRRLDGDNLQRALKAVRDGVADALGVDDGDARLEWRYEQAPDLSGINYALESSLVKGYGVHIRIEAKP